VAVFCERQCESDVIGLAYPLASQWNRPFHNPQKPSPKQARERHGARDPPGRVGQIRTRRKSYLRRPNPTRPEIIDAADWLRHDVDVSKPQWGDACLTMGRDLATFALAIVSTKDPEHFRTTPGGYFHGMVQNAKAGELHLERTVWALRRAAQPAQAPRSGQRRGSRPR
jgi:replication initiation protein RepC